jgi:two-component system response regulator ChvI
MTTIAKNYNARIIKNVGDCLIFYFPDTSNNSNLLAFEDVLRCGMTMVNAHRLINAKLRELGLPPLNYRISADYGEVQLAKSVSSARDDLFGSVVNTCSKINPKSPANSMIIGNSLYEVVKQFDTTI